METPDRKQVATLLREGELAFAAGRKLMAHARQTRAQNMIAAVKAGWSMREIAEETGLSFPRVQQIISQEIDRQNTEAAMSNLEDG